MLVGQGIVFESHHKDTHVLPRLKTVTKIMINTSQVRYLGHATQTGKLKKQGSRPVALCSRDLNPEACANSHISSTHLAYQNMAAKRCKSSSKTAGKPARTPEARHSARQHNLLPSERDP
jgi:hypothetical protein